jgi:hypothetical protein
MWIAPSSISRVVPRPRMRDGLAPAIRVEILVLVESPPDEHQLRVTKRSRRERERLVVKVLLRWIVLSS